jgi:hypothetical protein
LLLLLVVVLVVVVPAMPPPLSSSQPHLPEENDSFSDNDSDDDFLTLGDETGVNSEEDREAMIRRKLMESFYGKQSAEESAVITASSSTTTSSGNAVAKEEAKKAVETKVNEAQSPNQPSSSSNNDLDSPYFDPDAHTSNYVLHASVHDVLQVEERLALQVRTLDSTMQTLVYENYSKFIDATDAIRSIGVSVHANEAGLERLLNAMQLIQTQSNHVEDSLGGLRNAVAEKWRIQRLLSRLDALLKLPNTLQGHIRRHRYRLATQSFLSANAILQQHTHDFESLRTIQTDCRQIVMHMLETVQHQLMHWCGNTTTSRTGRKDTEESVTSSQNDTPQGSSETPHSHEEPSWTPTPEPPPSISAIFESASTLVLVLPKPQQQDAESTSNRNDILSFDAGLDIHDYKAAALTATLRHLERLLDTHMVDVQDDMFATTAFFETPRTTLSHESNQENPTTNTTNLIPTHYLDGMLEAATLFGVSFPTGTDLHLLTNFCQEAYASFLIHVKTLLLERTNTTTTNTITTTTTTSSSLEQAPHDEDEEGLDESYSHVSTAMTHLLRAVRELASALVLVGLDMDVSSHMVEQAVLVTETMVKRRVSQKFLQLRHLVVQDCLTHFGHQALQLGRQPSPNEPVRVVQFVQMASVALSDGLQMVDDTVKSILTGGVVVSDLKGVDYAMVKEAVQESCRRFATWLAATLELMAGCDYCQVTAPEAVEEPTEEDGIDKVGDSFLLEEDKDDDMSELFGGRMSEKAQACLQDMLDEIQQSPADLRSDLTLAIAEMCRLANRSAMENINQSINSTASASNRKHAKNTDIFDSTGPSTKAKGLSEQDAQASSRFLLAASRAITLYALNCGSKAAQLACRDLQEVARQEGDELPEAPRSGIISLLQIAREASIDCANIFGGDKKAGLIPDPPQDVEDAMNVSGSSPYPGTRKSVTAIVGSLAAVKGLSLDVERMFTQKVPTFPHPSHIVDFSRNAVVFIVFKVALNALVEQARFCTFHTKGYHQLQLDVMFLRYLLPHYVKDDLVKEGANGRTVLENVLNDVMSSAGDRCKDLSCLDQDRFYNPTNGETTTIQSIIRDFMADDVTEDEKEEHVKYSFLILD